MSGLPLRGARDLPHIDFDDLTRDARTIHLDLGTGLGHFAVEMAVRDPEAYWIAVEHEGAVARRAARRARNAGVANVMVLCVDARQLLYEWLPAQCLDHIWINFPDPWPKDRHADRRHTHPWMLQLLASALHPGGGLHLATDVAEYAEAFAVALAAMPEWKTGHDLERAELGVTTKYERKWLAQGRHPHYADWTRTQDSAASPWPTSIERQDAPSLDPATLPLATGVRRRGEHLLKLFPDRDGRQHGVLIDRVLGYDQHCVIDITTGRIDLGGVWTTWKCELFVDAQAERNQISANSAPSVSR